MPDRAATSGDHATSRRAAILGALRDRVYRDTDRLFGALAVAQWLAAGALALAIARPYAAIALGGGGVVAAACVALTRLRAGAWYTRHAVAIVQLAWSALLLSIAGDRAEAQLHAAVSLGMLALYRDWTVVASGTALAIVDRIVRDAMHGELGAHTAASLAALAIAAAAALYSCLRGAREIDTAARREVRIERTRAVIDRKVAERTCELEDGLERYRALVENTEAVQFEYDTMERRALYVSPQAARLFDCTVEELAEQSVMADAIHPDDRAALGAALEDCATGDRPSNEPIDYRIVTRLGRLVHVRTFVRRTGSRRLRGITLDVTRQKQLEAERQQLQKLESVGRVAAGVAHEINTPIQFIGDSLEFTRGAIAEIAGVFDAQRDAVASVLAADPEHELARRADDAFRHSDTTYLFEELPRSLDRASEGIDRVAAIVRSMKAVAHADRREMTDIDLNSAVASALLVARNSYRYVADVETDYGTVPAVRCHAGEISQVVLNLTLNAAHAIADVVGKSGARGRIGVTTRSADGHVTISVSDTGGGIPDAIADRVFEPFFTTKEVGKGTGQGLAVSRSVIVDRYQGSLTFETSPTGTTFHVRLPVRTPVAGAVAA